MGKSSINFRIYHEYFEKLPDDIFEISSNEFTESLLNKFRINAQKTSNGISLILNESLLNDDYTLEEICANNFLFKIRIKDDFFCQYTKLDCINRLKTFFLPIEITEDTPQNIIPTKDYYLGKNDLELISNLTPTIPESYLNSNRLTDIIFNIGISNPEVLSNLIRTGNEINIQLNFQCRATKWRYHVQFENEDDFSEHFIRDSKNNFEFRQLSPQIKKTGNNQIAFESRTPIPMKVKPGYNFQLLKKTSQGEQILIKSLPFATPQLSLRENKDDDLKEFSNIHIYI